MASFRKKREARMVHAVQFCGDSGGICWAGLCMPSASKTSVFILGFDTLSGDILAFPRKSYSRGIADSDDNFALARTVVWAGAIKVSTGADGLAVRSHGDPGVLGSTYHEIEGGRSLRGCGPADFSVWRWVVGLI